MVCTCSMNWRQTKKHWKTNLCLSDIPWSISRWNKRSSTIFGFIYVVWEGLYKLMQNMTFAIISLTDILKKQLDYIKTNIQWMFYCVFTISKFLYLTDKTHLIDYQNVEIWYPPDIKSLNDIYQLWAEAHVTL